MAPPAKSRSDVALPLVGLAVWAVVGSPTWSGVVSGSPPGIAWTLLYLGFAVAFWQATRTSNEPGRRRAALAIQSAAAILLAMIGMPHFEGALLAVVAAQAPAIVPLPFALVWAGIQAAPLFLVVLPTHGLGGAVKATGEYAAFALFAMILVHLRERERAARRELAHAHATLLATQSLMVDDTRQAERFRLAREVHDAIGHGLTAASLHLQLAKRTSRPEAVDAAQEAVKGTLADLRGLVGAMRSDGAIDLGAALRALATGIGEPEVHLALADDLAVDGPDRAHALFRCVQEALTNAIKHAQARHVWIAVSADASRWVATVRDDGVGAGDAPAGHGLQGIRERMVELGGGVETESLPGGGFSLRAFVPREAAP